MTSAERLGLAHLCRFDDVPGSANGGEHCGILHVNWMGYTEEIAR